GGWRRLLRFLGGLIKHRPGVLLRPWQIRRQLPGWWVHDKPAGQPTDAALAAAAQDAPDTPGLNLVGHAYAVLGRAEDARTATLACRAAGIPACLINRNGNYDVHLRDKHKDFHCY